jgi:hypothetical protein
MIGSLSVFIRLSSGALAPEWPKASISQVLMHLGIEQASGKRLLKQKALLGEGGLE